MSIIKYIQRLERMDELIASRLTGNATQFCEKLGISPSQVKEEINQMRQLGAKIKFSRKLNSYVYINNCRLFLRFDISVYEKRNRPIWPDDD